MGSADDGKDQIKGKKMNPRTTVVIPNYNGKKYLKECMDSLKKSTIPIKIILVDNGSEDGSIAFMKESYPQVRLLAFPENRGFSAAVNAGIRAADTEYVLLLNNDTSSEPELAAELEKVLDQEEKALCAGAKMVSMCQPQYLDGAGDYYCALGWAFARGKDQDRNRFGEPDRTFSACAGAALYRKSLLEEIGLFDEEHFAYLEDVDVGYRGNIYGYPSRYAPSAVVFHAGSGVSGSRHNKFKVELSARNSIYLIYKNMPFLQMLLNLPFLLVGYGAKLLFFLRKGLGTSYLKGLLDGFTLSFSAKGRQHKVRFRVTRLGNYLWIQGQLWLNMIRRLKG